jgi:hypothetical protein
VRVIYPGYHTFMMSVGEGVSSLLFHVFGDDACDIRFDPSISFGEECEWVHAECWYGCDWNVLQVLLSFGGIVVSFVI